MTLNPYYLKFKMAAIAFLKYSEYNYISAVFTICVYKWFCGKSQNNGEHQNLYKLFVLIIDYVEDFGI